MSRVKTAEVLEFSLPLNRPYVLSYTTFRSFDPFVVRITTRDGRAGYGEAHIARGSSAETPEGGRAALERLSKSVFGLRVEDALAVVDEARAASPVAATAMATALELAAGVVPRPDGPIRAPIVALIAAAEPDAVDDEVGARLAEGYRTFKVKVGKDRRADLLKVRRIAAAAGGRARLRLDANRAFTRDDAARFAAELDPGAVELFEQPCASDDWAANAAVARASAVPVMLDEPICSLADIDRAATIPNVGCCKVKLKRFGGIARLRRAVEAIHGHGMKAVVGDGIGSDLSCAVELLAVHDLLRVPGEFNGFLKLKRPLRPGLVAFDAGSIRLDDAAALFDPRLLGERTAAAMA